MSATPLLSDIEPTKARYQAGDRVVCKVKSHITSAQADKLRKSVKEFAGADINLIIINTSRFHVVRIRQGEENLVIAQMSDITGETRLGVANVDLAKVDFQRDDKLVVLSPVDYPEEQCRSAFKRWAGDDVEIIITR